VVEGVALEKRYARKGIVGSNPTLSAMEKARTTGRGLFHAEAFEATIPVIFYYRGFD
jgi:hypothetical protein